MPSAPGCCTSFRSRPMSRRASRCWTKRTTAQLLDRSDARRAARRPPRTRTAPLGRALAASIVAAADQTFTDVVTRRSSKRETITKWLARGGRRRDGDRRACPQRLALAPDDTPEAVEQEFFAGSLIPASEWPALIEAARDQRQKTEREQASASNALRALVGPRPRRCLSEDLLHGGAQPAQDASSPRRLATESRAGWTRSAARAGPRLRAARSASARCVCRERTARACSPSRTR